jgi:hypothetical protein
VVSVRTDLGTRVMAWQALNTVTNNDQRFFCHGYSFRTSYITFGKNSDYSLFGNSVPQALADEYTKLGTLDSPLVNVVRENDVLVWWSGATGQPYHSAIIVTPSFLPSGRINASTTLINSKTGTSSLKLSTPLNQEHYSKPQLIEKKNKARAASKASL